MNKHKEQNFTENILQDEIRTSDFVRNPQLENLLGEINSYLERIEIDIIKNISISNLPIILIMGPARSGTTLFLQWLASTGIFAYPTNLLSRFFKAPVLGAKIQLMLTDPKYNFRDELGDFQFKENFSSENGKTKGVLAPNEFWYFWRRFLPDPNRDAFSEKELETGMDTRTMVAELAGLTGVFKKPFAAKGMLFNYNIPFINNIFKNVLFIQIKRDPLMNIQSLLSARERQTGSKKNWYSFRIREFAELDKLDPLSQVAGQIASINKAILEGISFVSDKRKMSVDYEKFCHDPKVVFEELIAKLQSQGCKIVTLPKNSAIEK